MYEAADQDLVIALPRQNTRVSAARHNLRLPRGNWFQRRYPRGCASNRGVER